MSLTSSGHLGNQQPQHFILLEICSLASHFTFNVNVMFRNHFARDQEPLRSTSIINLYYFIFLTVKLTALFLEFVMISIAVEA